MQGEVYLRAMMSLIARQTFPPERLAEIVSPVANSRTYETFNLCDGSRTQAQIASALGVSSGNLSTTIKRWTEEGVVIKVVADDGKERPVHVYPVPDRLIKGAATKGAGDA